MVSIWASGYISLLRMKKLCRSDSNFRSFVSTQQSCKNHRDIRRHLARVEASRLNGDVKAQIECLSALCDLNVGILDDRVISSIEYLKSNVHSACVDSQAILSFVTCLHKFGDVRGLAELLPYFTKDVVFIHSNGITRLLRIYAVHFKNTKTFQDLKRVVLPYVISQLDTFSLDDKLSCLYSCINSYEYTGVVLSVLEAYVANVSHLTANDWRTLDTVLVALRIYRTVKAFDQRILIPELSKRSHDKVLECLSTLYGQHMALHGTVISRVCYLLAALCRNDNIVCDSTRLSELLLNATGNNLSHTFTAKSAIYLLRSLELFGGCCHSIRKQLEDIVVFELSNLSLSDMLSCLGGVSLETADIISSHLIGTVEELQPSSLLILLKFYAEKQPCVSPRHLSELRRRFLAICDSMTPMEFAKSLKYMASMRLLDRHLLMKTVDHIQVQSVNLCPTAMGLLCYSLGKISYKLPLVNVRLLVSLLQRDLARFGLVDLIRCHHFVRIYGTQSEQLYSKLMASIEALLHDAIPVQLLCNLALSTAGYANMRFQSLLYSVVFQRMKDMNGKQVCVTFKALSKSRFQNRDLLEKFVYFIMRQSSLDRKVMFTEV
ncbi:uncharacterized protein BXIN_1541 [Babesia sp. Xinjiang]|uniref:uncharacterized protein n=1 Tax=Babesia sp. Xinjiang TaxID=462227 RepID=UPI000A2632F4|nr:uncharacterized protein BXIN_1541 [Babesia sp. Xinjiang]ORM42291.1 hypothetical protein BXIN_1541 [Babesia sp. Xinjiang]